MFERRDRNNSTRFQTVDITLREIPHEGHDDDDAITWMIMIHTVGRLSTFRADAGEADKIQVDKGTS